MWKEEEHGSRPGEPGALPGQRKPVGRTVFAVGLPFLRWSCLKRAKKDAASEMEVLDCGGIWMSSRSVRSEA